MISGTGPCSVTATRAADDNYKKASITDTVKATKVPLTVIANDAIITFGQAIPKFTASYSGLVKIKKFGFSGSPSLTTTATACSPPGRYTITAALGTLASENYSFGTFKNGTLTIEKITPKVDLTVNGSTSSTVSVGDR
jgi:MBG domain (YGX type)